MAKEYAMWFYKTRNWEICRDGYMREHDYLCERCGAPAKIVHHKQYITPGNIHDPSITLSWDNLEALCQTCHNLEHHKNDATVDGIVFDANGNLISIIKEKENE